MTVFLAQRGGSRLSPCQEHCHCQGVQRQLGGVVVRGRWTGDREMVSSTPGRCIAGYGG